MKFLKQLFVVPVVASAFLSAGLLGGAFAWQGNNNFDHNMSTSFVSAHEVDFTKSTSINFSKSFASENFMSLTQNGSGENWNNSSPSFSLVTDNRVSSSENFSYQQNITYMNKSLVAFNTQH